MTKEYWYKDGLPFKCTGCGKCCTGSPGYVWVTEEEILSMAATLNITPQEFADRYLRSIKGRFSLKEKPVSYDCIFLEGKQCKIYENRPIQCRTYPFWPENLKSPAAWKKAAAECEGIHPDAPLISLADIKAKK